MPKNNRAKQHFKKVIPKQEKINSEKKLTIPKPAKIENAEKRKIVFSFMPLAYNEYFNLDAICNNWFNDLLQMLNDVSDIELKRIQAGEFSGKNSTLRIHNHEEIKLPCNLPYDIDLDDFWQMRISKSKGGIHGIFYENIFYVIWLDPHHNMYPDDKFGGLKKIKRPPESCCKERDEELKKLNEENLKLKEANQDLMDSLEILTKPDNDNSKKI